jgi:3',5'-cyclic AMP phosphodiesterase CpdA
MFTLAHLSDAHLPMPHARPVQLLNKRATGYYNWWRHRVHLHVPEALAGVVADIKAQKPDHIALTGDLVNVALPQEFRRAAEWLAAFDTPDRITVVPGNHDAYVHIPWADGMGLWGAYIASDGEPPAKGVEVFPTLRRRDGIALVGLSTGVPKPPFLATGNLGDTQIARAERMLGETGGEGLCRIVLIHHPPLTDQSRWKHLADAGAFQAMIRRVGCEAILHGHNHRSEIARIAGPNGAVPVLGVTSASAARGSRYGRARYHLLHIERDGESWRLRMQIRALKADDSGCEPDGDLVFHSAGTAEMVA